MRKLMVEYHVPKADEFKEGARREFSFLVSEFDFKECNSPFKYDNPYSIYFKKKNIFVYIEGLSYGFTLGVDIGKVGSFGKIKERFSLGYVVSLRNPELHEPRFSKKRGQLKEMRQSALWLKKCAKDFLNGDFTDLPLIKTHIEGLTKRNREQCEADELWSIGIKASKAFHTGDYKKVIELLQPMENKLSKAQLMLLSQANKRVNDSAGN